MKGFSWNKEVTVRFAAISLLGAACFFGNATAQKNEHYNSPLYSPRYYEPSAGVSNGLPDQLQRVGIEQRLGEQLPLEAKFKNEDGKEIALGDLFKGGRPVILA